MDTSRGLPFTVKVAQSYLTYQGRRRFLKSGTAIERHRRSARVEGTSRGIAREGDFSPFRKGGSGDLPRENF